MKYLFVLLLLTNFHLLQSQSISISGSVTDYETGEKLIGVHILDLISGKGAVTNSFGFYSLTLSSTDSARLKFSYIGYNSLEEDIMTNSNQTLNISLSYGNTLKGITVFGTKEEPIEQRNEMGVLRIPVKQVEILPAIGGESDILKALQLMPGIQSGNEGSSGIYVRGGSPEQNLVILDDVPLYYVNHLGGFVSTFNTDALNSVKLIKGGFPAQYGGRLSSVLDIRMKEGNMKEFKGTGMIGMIACKLSVEGPIKKDTTSYIISFRRFMYDLITKPLSKIVFDGVGIGYTFYDFNVKVNHRISEKDHLLFSFYSGDDSFSFKSKDKYQTQNTLQKSKVQWGNLLSAARWNHIYNHKLFSNLTLSYTQYHYNNEHTQTFKSANFKDEFYNSYKSGINNFNTKIDFEYFQSSYFKMKFGYSGIYHTFKPGETRLKTIGDQISQNDTVFGNYYLNALENSVYLENDIFINKRIGANIGARITSYYVNDTVFFFPEPRVLVNYLTDKSYSIKASYSRMQQNIHLLSNSGTGMPTDLWLPTTRKIIPEKADQFALGFAKSLKDNMFELSIETYYKSMKNLISLKEGSSFSGVLADWENSVENDGIGVSYGIEFFIQKKSGRTTGWIGYTLSKTTRQFENINNGKPFNYKYDRTHDISVVWSYKLNENSDVSATWVFGTGNAFTLATGSYYIINEDELEEIHHYDGVNTFRMKPFHKLDIAINFKKQKKWGLRVWNFSIYNVYNRQNPYYYYYLNVDNYGTTEKKLYQQSLFPFIPSVSYAFKF